jgi:RNA polymerase sigma-70 factor (ECF subfamily)
MSVLMADPPSTRLSLLVRLRDLSDSDAWGQFVELYAPLVYHYARRRGLQDADAADLTQDVLRSVAAAMGRFRYDPERGTFRSWLFTLVRHQLHHWARSRRFPCNGTSVGDAEVLEELPAPQPGEEDQWEQEFERRLLAQAVERARERFHENTWQAFWQTARLGRKAQGVAVGLGMSVAAVYMAKSRALAEVKRQVEQLRELHEE